MSTLELLAALPYITLTTLTHLGTLDKTQRREYTFEGKLGLSVSTAPDAWRKIARLGGLPSHRFHNDTGRFIDSHAIDDALWQQIYLWGEQQGYLEAHTFYAFEYEDDELDAVVRSVHTSLEEAQVEACGEHDIVPVHGFRGTTRFAQMVGEKQRDDANLILTILGLWCHDIDGVAWQDKLDVSRFSAPRALILNDRLSRWQHITAG